MNWKIYIGKVLRKSRMTQVKLAAELGCGQATIVDILSGRTQDPRGNLVLKLILCGRRYGLTDILQEPEKAAEKEPAA